MEVAGLLLPAEIRLAVDIGLDVNLVADANSFIHHSYALISPTVRILEGHVSIFTLVWIFRREKSTGLWRISLEKVEIYLTDTDLLPHKSLTGTRNGMKGKKIDLQSQSLPNRRNRCHYASSEWAAQSLIVLLHIQHLLLDRKDWSCVEKCVLMDVIV